MLIRASTRPLLLALGGLLPGSRVSFKANVVQADTAYRSKKNEATERPVKSR